MSPKGESTKDEVRELEDVVFKKSIKTRIHNFFAQILSFIRKEGALPEASEELTEELRAVNEKYKTLIKDDSFSSLKETYDNYKVGVNPEGGLIAVEKSTGYVKDDAKFVDRVRFLALWRKSAFGNFECKDEANCYAECFSEDSEKIYAEIKSIIEVQLKKTGNIDTEAVLNKMKDSPYKWGRVTSRRLFRTPAYAETVDKYFRSIINKSKKQTKPTLSLPQALYGCDEE